MHRAADAPFVSWFGMQQKTLLLFATIVPEITRNPGSNRLEGANKRRPARFCSPRTISRVAATNVNLEVPISP